MASNLDKTTGIYDRSKRYSFKNITDKPFVFSWDKNPITIQAGEELELPEYLALKATKELVDQIFFEEIQAEVVKGRAETKNPYFRSNRELAATIPANREPYEKKILRELKLNEADPRVQVIRAQIKEEITHDMNKKPAEAVSSMDLKKDFIEEVNLPA